MDDRPTSAVDLPKKMRKRILSFFTSYCSYKYRLTKTFLQIDEVTFTIANTDRIQQNPGIWNFLSQIKLRSCTCGCKGQLHAFSCPVILQESGTICLKHNYAPATAAIEGSSTPSVALLFSSNLEISVSNTITLLLLRLQRVAPRLQLPCYSLGIWNFLSQTQLRSCSCGCKWQLHAFSCPVILYESGTFCLKHNYAPAPASVNGSSTPSVAPLFSRNRELSVANTITLLLLRL